MPTLLDTIISPPAELSALRRTTCGGCPLVLVTKNQPAFFQVVRRYFYRHSIAGEGLDPILFHSACSVGDEFMTIVELNTVTSIGQYLKNETLEL